MKFEITYLYNGKEITTTKSDSALDITVTEDGIKNKIALKAIGNVVIKSAQIVYDYTYREYDSIFCNGYQTWTDSKEFSIGEKMNNLKQVPSLALKMYSFKSYGDIAFYDYKKNVLHAHDVAYIRGTNGIFIGNNNYEYAGIIIEFRTAENTFALVDDINMINLGKGEEITLFDFNYEKFVNFDDIKYFNQFKPRTNKKLVGYSSWYNHFDKINESIVYENLKAVDEHFDLFQIDDGYESKVGDWLIVDGQKFPNGLMPIVDEVHEKGCKAGIWIAPFVAQEGSALLQDHPEWLKLVDGKPVKCGCNWGGFYALDFYNEEVREYVKDCLVYYKKMGFDFFKLDFLYAVSLPLYDGKNRSQVACEAYRFLREILADKLILGNGCLMAPAFGVFDYVRVGCSITTDWDDGWVMRHTHRERNSTKTAIQNTIFRSMFNGKVFMNDPDVFLLRDNMKLTSEQKYSLAVINALFGSVLMTSDDIAKYNDMQKQTLTKIIDLAKNATYVKHRRKGELVEISYMLNGKSKSMIYNTNEGTIREIEERY